MNCLHKFENNFGSPQALHKFVASFEHETCSCISQLHSTVSSKRPSSSTSLWRMRSLHVCRCERSREGRAPDSELSQAAPLSSIIPECQLGERNFPFSIEMAWKFSINRRSFQLFCVHKCIELSVRHASSRAITLPSRRWQKVRHVIDYIALNSKNLIASRALT